jgi:hypothetical protein
MRNAQTHKQPVKITGLIDHEKLCGARVANAA